jgi:DNA-binding transcriptional regulator YiaG
MKKPIKPWGYLLVEEVKRRTGLTSDYQISQAIKISRANVSNWKSGKSNPDGETTLKLCILAKMSGTEALKIIGYPFVENES